MSVYEGQESRNPYVAPQTETEKALAKLWQEALGVKQVGIHNDFFELGGQSMLAVTIVSEVERVFGQRLSPASLIGAPTIHQFAEFLDREQPSLQKRRKLLDTTTIAQQVRSLIVENYLLGQDDGLKDSDCLPLDPWKRIG